MKKYLAVFLVVVAVVAAFMVATRSRRLKESKQATAPLAVNDTSTAPKSVTTSGGASISLANKGLTRVSPDLLNNQSATELDVNYNQLTGALPAEVRKLTNLEVLSASHNKMTGIPAEIGQLSKLRTVDFSYNNISGVPIEIGNLTQLQTLDLRGNPNISKNDLNNIRPKIPNAKILID